MPKERLVLNKTTSTCVRLLRVKDISCDALWGYSEVSCRKIFDLSDNFDHLAIATLYHYMIDMGVKEISQLEMKDIFNSNFYGERLKNFNQVSSKQTLMMKKQITTDKGRTVNMFYFN